MSTLPPLVEEDVAILMALWHDLNTTLQQQQGEVKKHRKSGLAREELADILVADKEHPAKPFRSDATLFKHLEKLKKHFTDVLTTDKIPAVHVPMPTQEKQEKKAMKGGKNRDSYQLAIGNVITWPETARIVIEVWDARQQHIEKETLILRIEALRLKRHLDGPVFKRVEIDRDIDFAVAGQYLTPYGIELMPGKRLRREHLYVAAVAEQCLRIEE